MLRLTLPLLLVVATTGLVAVPALAGDVVIFDRGGGGARAQVLQEAFVSAGHTVIGHDDTAALDVAYAGGCTDGRCYARAGIAGGVDIVVVAEPAHVVVVDVTSGVLRRRTAATGRLGVVALKLSEPGRWGTVALPALPPDAVVSVDGLPWVDEDLAPGHHIVVVVDAAHGSRAVEVDVIAGASTAVVLPVATPGPGPGLVVGLVGVGVGVAGLATALVGEAMFSAVPINPVPDEDAARALIVSGQVATIGWGVLVGGAAVALVGAGLVVLDPG